MVLFRSLDCAGGAGPAVEAPNVDVPGPAVDAGVVVEAGAEIVGAVELAGGAAVEACVVAVDPDGPKEKAGAEVAGFAAEALVPPRLNKFVDGAALGAAAEDVDGVAAVVAGPPKSGAEDGAEGVALPNPPNSGFCAGAVVVGADAGAVEVVEEAGKLNPDLGAESVEGVVFPNNWPELEGLPVAPPKRVGVAFVVAGAVVAGAPKLKAGFEGSEPADAGLVVVSAGLSAGLAPNNVPPVEGGSAGLAPKRAPPLVEGSAGLALPNRFVVAGAAPPNKLGAVVVGVEEPVEDEVVAAGCPKEKAGLEDVAAAAIVVDVDAGVEPKMLEPPVLAPNPVKAGGGPAGVVEGFPKLHDCPPAGVVLPNSDGALDPGVAGGCDAPNNVLGGSDLVSAGLLPKLNPVEPPVAVPKSDFCSPPLVAGDWPKLNPEV